MDLVGCEEESGESVGGFYKGFCGLEEVGVDFVSELGWEGEEAEGSR